MTDRQPPWLQPLVQRIFVPRTDAIESMQSFLKDQNIVRLPILRKSFLINEPLAAHHILLGNNKNYTKEGTSYSRLKSLMGPGLLTTSGEDWEERRNRFQPRFHGKNLKQFESTIQTYTQQTLNSWEDKIGKQVNISDEMLALSMNISSLALLGIDISERSLEFVRHMHFLNEFAVTRSGLPKWLPTIRNLRYQLSTKLFDNYLLEQLKTPSKITTEPLLSDLLQKNEQGEFVYSNDHILAEAKNFFIAGHETTGNAISWTLYSITKNPYVLMLVQREIKEIVGNQLPTLDAIERLTYLDMVINESLRMYPPIWLITRRAIADDVVLGYKIPANSLVNIITYLMHRHPKHWHQPDIFYPERFLPEVSKDRSKCAYLPFGFGPHVCIGRQFAMMNMKMIIVMALQRYQFSLPALNYEAKPQALITLKAKNGIKLKLEKLLVE